MKEVKLKSLKQSIRKLIKDTPEIGLKETKKFRCEKTYNSTYVCMKDKDGRSIEWFKVID